VNVRPAAASRGQQAGRRQRLQQFASVDRHFPVHSCFTSTMFPIFQERSKKPWSASTSGSTRRSPSRVVWIQFASGRPAGFVGEDEAHGAILVLHERLTAVTSVLPAG